jgi:branched-chain amino acid transport system substrate-binding protein
LSSFAALQVWASAANELKTLEREKIATRIRGGRFAGTVLGDIAFSPEGQLASRHQLFTVRDGKIEVRS